MDRLEVTGAQLTETLVAVGVLLGGVIAALLLTRLLRRVVRLVARERGLDDALVRSLGLPLELAAVAGVAYGAARTLSYMEPYAGGAQRALVAVWIACAVLAGQRSASTLFEWQGRRGAQRAGGPLGHVLPLARRALNVTIVVVGALLVLDQLGVSISPLLAGLGIGGLAVALALQPLLTNLFAGWYVLSDGSIRVGDVIALQGGPSGRVQSIGWRATRLRTVDGTAVVLPNATLAAATVTNYGVQRPREVSVVYTFAYGTDLAHAEHVVREAARAVEAEGEPLVLFQTFLAGGVECLVRVRARDAAAVPALTSALVQRRHAALLAAGLVGAGAPPPV